MDCTICKIIDKDIVGHVVFENRQWIAFLDHRPVFKGHCLLAPKVHYENVFDLPDKLGNSLLRIKKNIGNAILLAVQAEGLFIANNNKVSQSIPHLHFHLIPRIKGDGLKGFFWPRIRYESQAHMQQIKNDIKQFLSK